MDPLVVMMALPVDTTQGLTHEQVLPFLKKMENGQQREGKSCMQCLVVRTLFSPR